MPQTQNSVQAAPQMCTAEAKALRIQALADFDKTFEKKKKQYFKKVSSKVKRKKYLKTQAAKRAKLAAAANCTLYPTLPPSSSATCDFMLDPLEGAASFLTNFGMPALNEGKFPENVYHPSKGQYKAILIYVNYKSRPGIVDPIAGVRDVMAAELDALEAISFNQLSVQLDFLDRVITLPKTPQEYGYIGGGPPELVVENQNELFSDVIKGADLYVDFSQYTSVWIASARETLQASWGNHGMSRPAGGGVLSDGNEIRRFVTSDDYPDARDSMTALHEFAHTLGLADTGYGEFDGNPGTVKDGLYPIGRWDPMTGEPMKGPNKVHFLGWHKHQLGWLQPNQLTCIFEASTIEETLSPIETASGKKILVVPTSKYRAYVFEVRRKIGLDAMICREGVLVYRVDSNVWNGNGPIQSISPSHQACLPDGTPFILGEEFENNDIAFEVIGDDGVQLRVRVTKKQSFTP
ncbi:MAG: hypothetical protein ACO3XJ_04815 [Candidatus Nanopelagicales bacterium]